MVVQNFLITSELERYLLEIILLIKLTQCTLIYSWPILGMKPR